MAKKAKVSRKAPAATSQVPFGVKIIAVLVYAMSFFLLLSSLALLFSAGVFLSSTDATAVVTKMLEDMTASTSISTKLATTLPYIIGFGGVVALAFTFLFFFTGKGLLARRNWARIVVVVLFGVWFIGDLADVLRGDILRNLVPLIIDGVVSGYLLFNAKVQSAFAK